ncbi:MAG: dihydroxy-acid dehydratase, partial [Hyphomicrobiales bacterium]|nr:dihydroxy-acid dehydratase [Hyphomicrobiales bacterium]
ARRVPLLANLFPAGENLMEDFWFAGGLPALMKKIAGDLDLGQSCVDGRTLRDHLADAPCWDDDVIRGRDDPVVPLSRGRTLVVLRGNLAPDGAVMKTTAATAPLLKHRGPALVFDDADDMARRIDDPDLDVTEDTVLVLRNAGPVGAPGMPEWGNLPIPKKLLKRGVRDMVRLSDARMSGTHYGACVLHVAPEAAVGGPLSLLRTGDMVSLDAEAGRIDMEVDESELAIRRAAWKPPAETHARSWSSLYKRHVTQADKGCDFDFLEGAGGVPEPTIF